MTGGGDRRLAGVDRGQHLLLAKLVRLGAELAPDLDLALLLHVGAHLAGQGGDGGSREGSRAVSGHGEGPQVCAAACVPSSLEQPSGSADLLLPQQRHACPCGALCRKPGKAAPTSCSPSSATADFMRSLRSAGSQGP